MKWVAFWCLLCVAPAYAAAAPVPQAKASPGTTPKALMESMLARPTPASVLAHVHPKWGLHRYDDYEDLEDGGKIRRKKHACGKRLRRAFSRLVGDTLAVVGPDGAESVHCSGNECTYAESHTEYRWMFRKDGGRLYLWFVAEVSSLLIEEYAERQDKRLARHLKKARRKRCK